MRSDGDFGVSFLGDGDEIAKVTGTAINLDLGVQEGDESLLIEDAGCVRVVDDILYNISASTGSSLLQALR